MKQNKTSSFFVRLDSDLMAEIKADMKMRGQKQKQWAEMVFEKYFSESKKVKK